MEEPAVTTSVVPTPTSCSVLLPRSPLPQKSHECTVIPQRCRSPCANDSAAPQNAFACTCQGRCHRSSATRQRHDQVSFQMLSMLLKAVSCACTNLPRLQSSSPGDSGQRYGCPAPCCHSPADLRYVRAPLERCTDVLLSPCHAQVVPQETRYCQESVVTPTREHIQVFRSGVLTPTLPEKQVWEHTHETDEISSDDRAKQAARRVTEI